MTVHPRDIADRVDAMRPVLDGAAYRTPLESSSWLSAATGALVSLKLECYQPTGSFKVRGAVAAISRLGGRERARGIVTASAGNHGLGVAFAAGRSGVGATVVVPEEASPAKLSALRRFPVEILTGGPTFDTAERKGRELAAERNAHFISPYNDPDVIAGQGTIAPELVEDEPELDAVLIPVGGGGLIAGIGAWLRSRRPDVRIVGVQSEASPAMARALAAGRLIEIPDAPTLADGLSGNIEAGSITFPLIQSVAEEMVLVREVDIEAAIREAYHELHLALEGSAVVGIAALLIGRVRGLEGKRVAVIVTGRNIAAERLRAVLQ